MTDLQAQSYCDISTLTGPFELPDLSFSLDALEPHMSRETLKYHHGKHHAGYVEKTNELLQRHELKKRSLEQIIQFSDGALFNNAAQHWNHSFFWNCLTPNAKPSPKGQLLAAIERSFRSLDEFKKEFTKKAAGHFGSGYIWLIQDGLGNLVIECTSNAHTPITKNHQNPLLTLDVWEHAYYLDHRNQRTNFVNSFWKIVNWNFAELNFRAH